MYTSIDYGDVETHQHNHIIEAICNRIRCSRVILDDTGLLVIEWNTRFKQVSTLLDAIRCYTMT